jgi:hypothetical protein
MSSESKQSAVDAAADAALQTVRARHPKKDGRDTEKYYKQIFGNSIWSRSKWSEIVSGEKELKFRDKLVLIAAERLSSENLIFDEIFRRVGSENKHDITNTYDGLYRYWRYFLDPQQDKEILRWGLLKIATKPEGHTTLHHWSYDAIENAGPKAKIENIAKLSPEAQLGEIVGCAGSPEDEGIAICTDSKIFMLAFRKHNIRLAIADVPMGDVGHTLHETLRNTKINGLVLTNRHNTAIYGAAFVMFHATNDRFVTDMTDDLFSKTRVARADRKTLTLSHR